MRLTASPPKPDQSSSIARTARLRPEEEGGCSVQCLELPQAISQGETRNEALANIKEAIELVLDHLKEREKGKNSELVVV